MKILVSCLILVFSSSVCFASSALKNVSSKTFSKPSRSSSKSIKRSSGSINKSEFYKAKRNYNPAAVRAVKDRPYHINR